jgi:hypothetical protein
MSRSPTRDQWILRGTYVLLIVYNAILFYGKYVFIQGTIYRVYRFIEDYILYFTILEFMGMAAVFVDLITDWENKPVWRRACSLLLGMLLVSAFIFKVFINWVHSTLLVD